MFCPNCGAKNELGVLKCFVCEKTLPSLVPTPGGAPPPRVVRVAVPTQALGSIGDRMLALIVDRILLLFLIGMTGASLSNYVKDLLPRLPSFGWTLTGATFGWVLLIFLYHFLLEAAFGSTLGKAIFGLRVTIEGERGRLGAAAIRNALRIVDVIGFYAIGFFIALFSPRKQRLGDYMASTVVIEVPVHWAVRATWLLLWLVLIGTSAWVASSLCPSCVPYQEMQIPWR